MRIASNVENKSIVRFNVAEVVFFVRKDAISDRTVDRLEIFLVVGFFFHIPQRNVVKIGPKHNVFYGLIINFYLKRPFIKGFG